MLLEDSCRGSAMSVGKQVSAGDSGRFFSFFFFFLVHQPFSLALSLLYCNIIPTTNINNSAANGPTTAVLPEGRAVHSFARGAGWDDAMTTAVHRVPSSHDPASQPAGRLRWKLFPLF